MTNPLVPIPDYDRLSRTFDPSVLTAVPALPESIENANQVVDKPTLKLNRAGTDPGNPILQGMGARITFYLDRADELRGVYVFQDRADHGPNRIGDVLEIAPSTFAIDVIHGVDWGEAGNPTDGAARNFLRIESRFGVKEAQYWVKSQDRDVVTLNGLNALEADAVTPITIQVTQVDPGADWLDVAVDFMQSWNDEFHKLHRATSSVQEQGFLKSYGGSLFVSVFDTDESEGVGDEINPFTEQPIKDTRTVEVENTAGVKQFTFRFRAKAGSTDFVDVPVEVEVIAGDDVCLPPILTPCADIELIAGTLLPANTPDAPSVPNVQVVAGTVGVPLSQDLLYIAVVAFAAHSGVKLRLRRWGHVSNPQKIDGYAIVQVGATEDYLALQLSSFGVPPPGYLAGQIHAIALSVASENVVGAAWYTVSVIDDDLESNAVLLPGPKGRDIGFYAPSGLGGGTGCCGPSGCVADLPGE